MQKFALARVDGGVSIISVVSGTVADAMAKWAPSVQAEHTGAAVPIGDSDHPQDRIFRGSWILTGSAVVVGMPAARILHMGRIRTARDTRLAVLDGQWMRATARGDTTGAAAIETQRETLRNIPQTFDLSGAATPDALNALWPAQVPRP